MPIFEYKALNSEGQTIESQIFAADEEALTNRLKNRGLDLISLRLVQESTESSNKFLFGGLVVLIGFLIVGAYLFKKTTSPDSPIFSTPNTVTQQISKETNNQIIPENIITPPPDSPESSNEEVEFKFRAQATQQEGIYYIPFRAEVIQDNNKKVPVANTQFRAWPAPDTILIARKLMNLQSEGDKSYYQFKTDSSGQALIRLLEGSWYFSAKFSIPNTNSTVIWGKEGSGSKSLLKIYGLKTKILLTHNDADEIQGENANLVY